MTSAETSRMMSLVERQVAIDPGSSSSDIGKVIKTAKQCGVGYLPPGGTGHSPTPAE